MIGCRLFLEAAKNASQQFHRVLFSINGSALDHPFWLEGYPPISIVSIRDQGCEETGNEIDLNMGEVPFTHSIGKYTRFS